MASTLGDAIKVFWEQLSIMRSHCFIAKIQLRQIRAMKYNLKEGEAIMQADFSENFNIKHQDEIMSAHWATNYVFINILDRPTVHVHILLSYHMSLITTKLKNVTSVTIIVTSVTVLPNVIIVFIGELTWLF